MPVINVDATIYIYIILLHCIASLHSSHNCKKSCQLNCTNQAGTSSRGQRSQESLHIFLDASLSAARQCLTLGRWLPMPRDAAIIFCHGFSWGIPIQWLRIDFSQKKILNGGHVRVGSRYSRVYPQFFSNSHVSKGLSNNGRVASSGSKSWHHQGCQVQNS